MPEERDVLAERFLRDPVSKEATIIMLQERLAAMTEERDFLFNKCDWLGAQEFKAWEQVRAREHELATIREGWSPA